MLEKESGEEGESGSHGPCQVPRLQVHLKGFQEDRAGVDWTPQSFSLISVVQRKFLQRLCRLPSGLCQDPPPTLTTSTRISPGSLPSGVTSELLTHPQPPDLIR